jgi:hypothetical protein
MNRCLKSPAPVMRTRLRDLPNQTAPTRCCVGLINMRFASWLLAAAILLLVVAGTYRTKQQSLLPVQKNSVNSFDSRPRTKPQIALTQPVENRTSENSPKSAPSEDHVSQWLSVSPVARTILMSHEAMEPYEAILASLNLPPDRLRRLQELIVEREESANDVDDLSKEYRVEPASTAIARADAVAASDREMADIVGEPNGQKVRQMLSLKPQLEQVVHSVGRDLAQGGAPLNADNLLQLAQIYKDSYAPPLERGFLDRTAGFDSETGLGDADRQTLARASVFLTPEQMDVLRMNLAATTTTYANASR